MHAVHNLDVFRQQATDRHSRGSGVLLSTAARAKTKENISMFTDQRETNREGI